MPVWEKYVESCTRSSVITSAVIVNYSLMSRTIIFAILTDIVQVLVFISSIDKVIVGVLTLVVVCVLSLFGLRGIARSPSTSALSVRERVPTTERRGRTLSGMTVSLESLSLIIQILLTYIVGSLR